MAVTIGRTAWTDDDGTGQTGTILNNAAKTALYDEIDTALALLLPLAGGTLSGHLLFTDATYDIGASGATRPRDLFLSRNATIGGTLTAAGDVGMAATKKLYLDGVAMTGNTYIFEEAPDTISFVTGGTRRLQFTNTLVTFEAGVAVAISTFGAFAGGDKYVIADASGNLHKSALGPGS